MTDVLDEVFDGVIVGPAQADRGEDGSGLRRLSTEEFAAMGIEAPTVPADHYYGDEPVAASRNLIRVTGQFGGFGLHGENGRKFKVMSTPGEDQPDMLGQVIEVFVRAGLEWLLGWVTKQAAQKGITITELALEKVGESYELIDASTEWPMAFEMQTIWKDTCVVFLGQTPYAFQPGENYSGTVNKTVKGPAARQRGWAHVRIVNTAGAAYEIIGNWSIDVTFKLKMGGKEIGQGHFNGYEPRGWHRDWGPLYFGALD